MGAVLVLSPLLISVEHPQRLAPTLELVVKEASKKAERVKKFVRLLVYLKRERRRGPSLP